MEFKIVRSLGRHPFGGNALLEIEIAGRRFQALRQGILGFWAFPLRPSLSREQAQAFDLACDQYFAKHSELESEAAEPSAAPEQGFFEALGSAEQSHQVKGYWSAALGRKVSIPEGE